jgi:predicted ATPase
MIRRFYVHNFRCLENFELNLSNLSSVLLIGQNGAGKSTVGFALEILQKIARGANRVGDLVKPEDIAFGRSEVPVRFEIEVELLGELYQYDIALELPDGFRELRIFEEQLLARGEVIFTRERAQVRFAKKGAEGEAKFLLDWFLAALPIVQERTTTDPLFIFKQWLARMLILRPIPSLILGNSSGETLQPNAQVTDFGDWFSGLLAYAPAAYARIDGLLRQTMPDFKDVKNPVIAKDARNLLVQFGNHKGSLSVPFQDLSDGEKCFMIWAVTLAANENYGPIFCFWDEPDNYLAVSEIGHLTMELRKEFASRGQFLSTSHNSESIRRFSHENTFVLHRKSHLEPTLVRSVADIQFNGDLVGALIRGDVDP